MPEVKLFWQLSSKNILLLFDVFVFLIREGINNLHSKVALSDPGSMKCSYIFRTVSPQLGDNYASECSSKKLPHTKYMSPCMETFRTTLWCFVVLQSLGKKSRKTMGLVFLHFRTFSPGLETNYTLQCNSDSFSCTVTYILCVENCKN